MKSFTMKQNYFNSSLFAHGNFCTQLDSNSAQCSILNKNSVYYSSISRVKHFFLYLFCYDPTKRETFVRRQVSTSLLWHPPPPNGCSASTGREHEQKFRGHNKKDPICSWHIRCSNIIYTRHLVFYPHVKDSSQQMSQHFQTELH